MILREFMETDIYRMADCIEYTGDDGMEIEYNDSLLNLNVENYHDINGFLEIELKTCRLNGGNVMKNIRESQIKKCFTMSLDDFRILVEKITSGLKTVEYEYGIYIEDSEKAEETGEYWCKDILEALSDYFDTKVISYHSDNNENCYVWICYQ